MGKFIVIGIFAVAAAFGGYFWWSNIRATEGTPAPVPSATPSPSSARIPQPAPTPANGMQTPMPNQTGAVKSFIIAGTPFKFSLAEIRVKQGDTVRIIFQNLEGRHDWRVDEFNAATTVLESGKSETVEFVADKTGVFEYYCSVGNHQQMGMKGNLIVE